MKKILVALLIAVMSFGTASAGLKFGIKAGVNVNHLSTNLGKIDDGNNRAGWTAGVMTEYQVPIIGLCVDLSLMYARLYSTADKNFLQVPLNLKYKFSLPVVGKFLAPYIFTGPSFDFKLGKKTDLKTFQPVWNLGLGLQLVNHLQIGASYGFGMTNIMKNINLPAGYDTGKWHNNYWTITAAYLF
ncbi:MAG: outer membrane beta-barrel protein [Muribaculaceae bacterium]|nr:outer membrane beta-barrel protein [Muribaculaceae bacterium]